MKRLHIFGSLIFSVAVALTAVSCINDIEPACPASDDVSVHFRISTPKPTPATVDTRAIDVENTVIGVALLVFQRDGGTGEFLYRYMAEGRSLTQDIDTEAHFMATLRETDEQVKLLAIANYQEEVLNSIAPNATEAEVRKALIGDINGGGGIPMTGVKQLAGISKGMETIRIPMLRSVAKITIEKRATVTNFTITSVRIYRTSGEFQYFPNPGAVSNEDGAGGSPLVNAVSVSGKQPSLVVTSLNTSQNYTNYMTETAANSVVDETTCVVVGGRYNGSPTETFYRMDFDTDASAPIRNPMGQVLRNHWYRFVITEVTGPGWPNAIDAADNLPTDMTATVTPWIGVYDYYIILNRPDIVVADVINASAALYIITSGVPFTITSERNPDLGPLSTAIGGLKTMSTDILTITLTNVGGVAAGQQRWQLMVTARTAVATGDTLSLTAETGAVIRIPVTRN